MGKLEKIVSMGPPVPTAKAIRTHRGRLEIERDTLRAGAAELALASANGNPDAKAALTALPAKLAALQFEIDLNDDVYDLAVKQDAAAEVAWRAAIQTLPPEEIIAGIGKELCCGRCTPGINGGCVITGAAPYAGGTCGHPIKERHLFHRNERGKLKFPYRDNPQASRVFDTACARLNVLRDFV